ncbi:MAG: glycosyltransferase family 4 protein [Candidatus Accumulibacter sp.]|nr:glycosyltransferase family 4 protein [Accumulibacter sp.]MCB1942809.1 glycosyltransferase family 4 protein [Accumulibacter sp.]MCP5248703.1 glycosyltransferase family 4 protein [Accumulibacter sp.]
MPGETTQAAAVGDSWPAICIVGPLPPPSGGMANQCEQLVRLLRDDGLDVELVCTNAPYRPAWVGKLPVLRAAFRLLPYLLRLWQAAGRAGVMHVLANSGWAWHLFAAPALSIARLRKTPLIVNYRGGNAEPFFARAPRHVLRMLAAASLRVTPSTFLQRVFSAHGLTAVVIPNIIDLSRFAAVPRRSFGDAPQLLVTRNLEPIYDIPTAIRAFAGIVPVFPAARLTVAGSGPELLRLQALVAELGLQEQVAFSGRIDNAAIPALYAAADCLVNASTVDNMPISILEAFASGVPVVSTAAGGIPDLVEQGVSGLLVPVGDHQAMTRELLRVLQDAQLAAGLRAAGLRQAQRYAWPQVRKQWLDAYRRVAAARRTA